jgi:Terpene cyclase DEP1
MQIVYIIACIAGTVLPLSQFVPWIYSHGLDVPLLVQQAVATPVSAFAWTDVLVSGATVAIVVVVEGRRLAMHRLWLPLLGLVVGPSLALPLFLLLRERHIAGAGPNNSFKPNPLRRSA